MLIILKKISPTTSVSDIKAFVEPVLLGGFFKSSGRLSSIRIQKAHLLDSHTDEYQALIKIQPDAVARRAIRLLDRKRCADKPINVAEYHVRLHQNDRRVSKYKSLSDRRKKDRRRRMALTDITDQRQSKPAAYDFFQDH